MKHMNGNEYIQNIEMSKLFCGLMEEEYERIRNNAQM